MFGRPLSLRSPVGKRKIYGRHRNRRMFWWVYKEKVKPDFICDLKAVFLLYCEKDVCGSTKLTYDRFVRATQRFFFQRETYPQLKATKAEVFKALAPQASARDPALQSLPRGRKTIPKDTAATAFAAMVTQRLRDDAPVIEPAWLRFREDSPEDGVVALESDSECWSEAPGQYETSSDEDSEVLFPRQRYARGLRRPLSDYLSEHEEDVRDEQQKR